MKPATRSIVVTGARVHNLNNVSVSIPRDKLVVFTGVSGSGKSSLAFDTIFAEGQRRYFDTLSAYSRQFVASLERPDVDSIEGLSPSISVDQKGIPTSPRSTVGTVTEIYDYLRLLYTAVGRPFCPSCDEEIRSMTPERIARFLIENSPGAFMVVLAPVVSGRKGVYRDLIEKIAKQGYQKVRVDGAIYDVDDKIEMARYKAHDIEIVIDRLTVSERNHDRLLSALRLATREGGGTALVHDVDSEKTMAYSTRMACPSCGFGMPSMSPRMFSFNNPAGACPRCDGIGFVEDFDLSRVIPDASKCLAEGGVAPLGKQNKSYLWKMVEAAMESVSAPLDAPIKSFTREQMDMLLYGRPRQKFKVRYKTGSKYRFATADFEGVMGELQENLDAGDVASKRLHAFVIEARCPDCLGSRLNTAARAVRIAGRDIASVSALPVSRAIEHLKSLSLDEKDRSIGGPLLSEVVKRLEFLDEVGLAYLTLDRTAGTLSGGEFQRVRLAAQIGTYLSGVTYVLDEPTVGLHPRDNNRLLDTLVRLRDLGNTVIVVEHDEATIHRADYIVDIGPRAGRLGGDVVATGSPADIENSEASLTGAYLSGRKKMTPPETRREPAGWLELEEPKGNNLKGETFRIPLGVFACLTGVSGSGKSSLAMDTLLPAIQNAFGHAESAALPYRELRGWDELDRVLVVDASPIGKTSRSTPATYTGVFNEIRKLYAMLPEARARGYKEGRFSYNVKGGRCEACEGNGDKRVEMHFLPDVFVTCPVCNGRRYNQETMEITFRGKSIADALEMTCEEALEFFENIPKIKKMIEIVNDIGLGYLRLGQPGPTLSTGEAQRIKLATELKTQSKRRTLFVLDEPTTGLHFADVKRLVDMLNRLVARGHSVLVIEHNLDVIACADHVIDLGPEGGEAGGRIVAQGSPEVIAANAKSHTGRFLKHVLLANGSKAKTPVKPTVKPKNKPKAKPPAKTSRKKSPAR